MWLTYEFSDVLVDEFSTGSFDDLSAVRGGVVAEPTTISKSLDHIRNLKRKNIPIWDPMIAWRLNTRDTGLIFRKISKWKNHDIKFYTICNTSLQKKIIIISWSSYLIRFSSFKNYKKPNLSVISGLKIFYIRAEFQNRRNVHGPLRHNSNPIDTK